MKSTMIALAAISALTLGALGSAAARDKAHAPGAHKRAQVAAPHRAGPINARRAHALPGRAHAHPGKRNWRMQGRHYRMRPGWWRHRPVHRSPRWRHRPGPWVQRAYPAHEGTERGLGVEIETREFRFSANKSG